jgi:signal peptidase II
MKERMKHLLLFILVVGLDQAVKFWVRNTLMNQDPLVIIPNVLSLQYHENTGAVWGMMSGKVQFLSTFTLIIMILIGYLYFKIPQTKRLKALRIIAVLILGGAVGNLIDRLLLGHVVDFIYFEIIDFPLFNIADSFLTVSCILLFILAIFYYKDEDFAFLDQLLHKKKAGATAVETKEEEPAKESDILFDRDQEQKVAAQEADRIEQDTDKK